MSLCPLNLWSGTVKIYLSVDFPIAAVGLVFTETDTETASAVSLLRFRRGHNELFVLFLSACLASLQAITTDMFFVNQLVEGITH